MLITKQILPSPDEAGWWTWSMTWMFRSWTSATDTEYNVIGDTQSAPYKLEKHHYLFMTLLWHWTEAVRNRVNSRYGCRATRKNNVEEKRKQIALCLHIIPVGLGFNDRNRGWKKVYLGSHQCCHGSSEHEGVFASEQGIIIPLKHILPKPQSNPCFRSEITDDNGMIFPFVTGRLVLDNAIIVATELHCQCIAYSLPTAIAKSSLVQSQSITQSCKKQASWL